MRKATAKPIFEDTLGSDRSLTATLPLIAHGINFYAHTCGASFGASIGSATNYVPKKHGGRAAEVNSFPKIVEALARPGRRHRNSCVASPAGEVLAARFAADYFRARRSVH
jgi:hypothetical protein